MLKRMLSILLCLCMLLSMCPVGFAEEAEEPTELVQETEETEETEETAGEPEEPETEETEEIEETVEEEVSFSDNGTSGDCGDGLTWSLDEEGILTITGQGDMPDYDSGSNVAPWYRQRQNILSVYVDQGVTKIGNYAFYSLYKLDSVVLGEDVRSIGECAFQGDTKLRDVNLSEGLRTIRSRAFSGCTALTEITIPDRVTEVQFATFENCAALAGVRLPSGLKEISSSTFADCGSLREIEIPEGITKILAYAFKGCTSLTSVVVPEGVTKISFNAFEGCTGLKSVRLPESLEYLGDEFLTKGEVFSGCVNLETVNLPSGMGAIYEKTFYGCKSLKDLEIPEGVTSIGYAAFSGCGSLSEINIPEAVTKIEGGAFAKCAGLRGIVIPEGVTYLGYEVFSGCTNLQTVKLPETVTRIEYETFKDCASLVSVSFPRGLQGIGYSAFQGCSSLTEVSLPEGITALENYTFNNCTNLTNITLPDGLTGIGSGVFSGCKKLPAIAFPEGVTTIGGNAFSGCDSLTEVEIPQGVRQIGNSSFSGCTQLKKVILSNGLTAIGDSAFSGCTALTEWDLPQTIGSIGSNAFYNCPDSPIFDLSAIPDTLDENLPLSDKVSVPEFFASATGGKVSLYWSLETIPGEQDASQSAYISQNTLHRRRPGRFRLVCRDSYTGIRSSKIMEVTSNLQIRPVETAELVSGRSLRLTAVTMPEGSAVSADWSLAAGSESAASISRDGVLTAKYVAQPTEVTVVATLSTGDTARKTVTVLPAATGLGILLDGKPAPEKLTVDMLETRELSLSAAIQPEGAKAEVKWTSGEPRVATVDEGGKVTLLSPGKTVIYANTDDGSGVRGELLLVVTYLDGAETLTLRAEKTVLEPGEQVWLILAGDADIPAELVTFSVVEDDRAQVDESGVLTAGSLPGKVTVVAALNGDPMMRKATLELRIAAALIRDLRLVPEFADERATVEESEDTSWVRVESAKLGGKSYSFQLAAQGRGTGPDWMDTQDITYSSTNTALATVTATGKVTVKAKAEGECYIVAKSKDALEAETRLGLSVLDRSPRLGSSKLTLNSYREEGISTGLVESYGNTIQSVAVYDYNKSLKGYGPEPSQVFTVSWEESMLTMTTGEPVKNGNYALKLTAVCENGTYDYILQVKVANALPKVTAKQRAKFNLFYLDSAATLKVTAAGCTIEDVTLTGTDTFCLSWSEDGIGEVTYSADFLPGTRANPKGKLNISLEGYRVPVTLNFTLATVNTAPKLTVTPGSGAINLALNGEKPESWVKICQSGQPLDLSEAEIRSSGDFVELETRGEDLLFRLTGVKGGTVNFMLRQPNWVQEMKLSYKLIVENKLPTVKLAAGTLKLNSLFPWQGAETTLRLSQCNLNLGPVFFVSTAKAGSSAAMEAEKLTLSYDPKTGKISAGIQAGETPKAGTYGFTVRTSLADTGTDLSPVTLKVTVAAAAPKVKLSAGAVKLNRALAGAEEAKITVTVSDSKYRVVDFVEIGDYEELTYAEGFLTVALNAESKNRKFKLTPVLEDVENGQVGTLPTAINLALTVYSSEKLGVSLAAKGKLDTLKPESAIVYTVTKLTNCLGPVEAMTLEGLNADQFRAELDTSGTKPVVTLNLLPGESYDTRTTYKVQFRFTACGRDILSPVQNVKVAQSALKVTAPKTVVYYRGQSAPLRCDFLPSAEAAEITLGSKTDKVFLQALGDKENMTVEEGQIRFRLENPGALKVGKSYAVLLDVTPEGSAVNMKPTQVKLTVKVVK